MQITVLGSGTAAPTARRSCAGYLVEWHLGALLLDASAGTYQRALKAGLDPERLSALVLTHFHPDHTADLPAILSARRQIRDRLGTLLIAGPEGTADLLDRFRDVYGGWIDVPVEIHGFPFECDGLLVQAWPADHTPEARCLRLTCEGKSVGFSGDTADCEGVRAACMGVDLALLECSTPVPHKGHLSPAECEEIVQATAPRRALLTHLGPDVEPTLPVAEDGLVVSV